VIGGMPLSTLLALLIRFYTYLIVAYILLSWFPLGEGVFLDVYRVLASICEPYIAVFRRIVPVASVGGGGLDFSPLVALLVLQLVGQLVVGFIAGAGY
jgi:YggT family protein